MNLAYNVIQALKGRTIGTAESCTGGGIGAALTAIPGSSAVYKGGIVSYTNEVKMQLLNVDAGLLDRIGAVSAEVAEAMALGARNALHTDVAVSVTGLAGPGGDDRGTAVGTVYIGYTDATKTISRRYCFDGDRAFVRQEAIKAALQLVLDENEAKQ